MTIFQTLLFTIGGFLALTTFLSFLRTEVWWIRILDFPRLQSFWMQIACGILYVIFFFHRDAADWILLAALLAGTTLHGYMIIPYTFFTQKQVMRSATSDENSKLTMLVSNVLMTNRKSQKLLDEIAKYDPDIVFCVETDKWWAQQLSGLKKKYEWCIEVPLENTYGLILYSKLKLVDPEVKYLVQDDIPSIHADIELRSGERFTLYGVHPRPPAPAESKSSVPRDAELVIVGREAKANGGPCIVTGDMNDVGWSQTTRLFQKLSGLLDPRIGRGMYCTFHADYFFSRWSLDHVFISRHFRLCDLKRLKHIGSDHFPLCFTVTYEPEKKEAQEKPTADASDQKQADEKLRKADEQA